MIRHKNSLTCLIFELKFLSHVYISMQNDKTIWEFLEEIKEFLEIYLTVFVTQFLTQIVADRPGRSTVRSTEPWAGRPGGRSTCTALCTSGGHMGRSTGRSTGPESLALCIWAVDRAVDRISPTVIILTVGGRPAGRPQACQAARSA